MGKSHMEKLCKGFGYKVQRGWRHWYKRQGAKLMRRLWRRLGEDAPGRLPIRGWSD